MIKEEEKQIDELIQKIRECIPDRTPPSVVFYSLSYVLATGLAASTIECHVDVLDRTLDCIKDIYQILLKTHNNLIHQYTEKKITS